MQNKSRAASLLWAAVSVAIAFGWQLSLVYGLYGGNWTSLFHHGDEVPAPADPIFRGTYYFEHQNGYDGQHYRFLAHDPWLTRGFTSAMDGANLRCRRILIPILAYLISLGDDRYIDTVYQLLILASLFLTAYWLSRYACRYHANAAWGLAVLLIPGVWPSIERQTLDVVLIGMTLGFALYASDGPRWLVNTITALAALTRESGLILVAASAAFALRQRKWKEAAVSAMAALPALGWYAFVWARHLPPDPERFQYLNLTPFGDLWSKLIEHNSGQFHYARWLAGFCYYLAVFGVLLAFFYTLRYFRAYWATPAGLSGIGFTLMAVAVRAPGMWSSEYHFGRIFGPLLVLLALEWFSRGDWRKTIPLFLVLPGISIPTGANLAQMLALMR